jgi:hypothetical protein
MPDWAFTELRGPAAVLNVLRDPKDPTSNLDFEQVIPMPPFLIQTDDTAHRKRTGQPNWHTWRLRNWGTKWNACYCSLVQEGESAIFHFSTAWSHPEPVIRKLSELFPLVTLDVRYTEQTESGFGAYQIRDGRIFPNGGLPEHGTREARAWIRAFNGGPVDSDEESDDVEENEDQDNQT